MSQTTLHAESTAELEEKGSRFLACLLPLAMFDERASALRTEHRKACHFVTAWRRMNEHGQVEEYANDDGEPAGSSGMPALRVLKGADLVDAGVIVVRHFGGIKLGTGGLARAYAGVTSLAVQRARPVPWVRLQRRVLRCRFDSSGTLEHRIATLGLTVLDRTFDADGLSLTVEGKREDLDKAELPDWH